MEGWLELERREHRDGGNGVVAGYIGRWEGSFVVNDTRKTIRNNFRKSRVKRISGFAVLKKWKPKLAKNVTYRRGKHETARNSRNNFRFLSIYARAYESCERIK